ncbi:hypothetical protein BGZ46_002839 [Entomortierella lignicola]|nr:hypothetical protein BGZ46_002839 [Entomortierella lignicola]
MTTTRTSKATKTPAQEDLAVEALRKGLAAITLELKKKQEELESGQAELEAVQSSLAESHLELQDTKDAFATSERARLAAGLELEEANRHRVHSRPDGQQEERKAVDQVIESYKARYPELDAVEMLRVDPTPRAQNVHMQMKADADAPIKFSRQNFILKNGKSEDEMIAYIQQAFSAYAPVNSTASTA